MKLFSVLLISLISTMPLAASEFGRETDAENRILGELDVLTSSLGVEHFISKSFSNAILSDNLDAFIRTMERAKKVGYADELLLHRAISNDAKKITAFLINNGADLSFLHDQFSSPLLSAIMLKKCWAVSMLIKGGANVNEIVYWPGKPVRLISDYAIGDRCIFDEIISSGARLGELAEFAKGNQEVALHAYALHKFWRDSETSRQFAAKVLATVASAFAIKSLYSFLRGLDVKPRFWRSKPRPSQAPQDNTPKKPRLSPPLLTPLIAGEVLSFVPDLGNPIKSADKNIRHLIEAIRDAMNNNDIVLVNRHLADLRGQIISQEPRENLRKAIQALVSEIETFSGPLSAAAILDSDLLSEVREAVARREPAMQPDEAPATLHVDDVRDVRGIREVRFSRGALNDVPEQLMAKVLEWRNMVEENGLHASRQDSSLNDEAVGGTDLRAVRLNHKYRLFYRVVKSEGVSYVRVTTVNPHQYQRAKNS